MIDRDYVIYIVLFSLISLNAYREKVQKERIENRLGNNESMCRSLIIKKKYIQERIDSLEMRIDSLYLQLDK